MLGFDTKFIWYFCRDAIGVPSVVAAMIGLSILLLSGVLDWSDCLNEKSAWDTLIWFAAVVGMASQLTDLGIVGWMSDSVAKFLSSFSLSWPAAFGVLQAVYFFIHYLFASQTGHVGALYAAFLAMQVAAGVPGIMAALALSYSTNLFGALTHYSSGQAAVYYGGIFLIPHFKHNSLFKIYSLFSFSYIVSPSIIFYFIFLICIFIHLCVYRFLIIFLCSA